MGYQTSVRDMVLETERNPLKSTHWNLRWGTWKDGRVWFIASVLKTEDCKRSGGSNPSLSSKKGRHKIFIYSVSSFSNFCDIYSK